MTTELKIIKLESKTVEGNTYNLIKAWTPKGFSQVQVKVEMQTIRRRLVRYMHFLLNQLRLNNPDDCGNPPQSPQSHDCLQQSSANDTRGEHLDKDEISHRPPNTGKQNNCSEYKTFLCDYQFKGEKYCIEILASSWSEAEQHVRCIAGNGKIVGESKLEIKIPFT